MQYRCNSKNKKEWIYTFFWLNSYDFIATQLFSDQYLKKRLEITCLLIKYVLWSEWQVPFDGKDYIRTRSWYSRLHRIANQKDKEIHILRNVYSSMKNLIKLVIIAVFHLLRNFFDLINLSYTVFTGEVWLWIWG